MNYFSLLCFAWAAVGLASRALMAVSIRRWTHWELNRAYPANGRPRWVLSVCAGCVLLVLYTWGMVWRGDTKHGWAAAALLTFTLFKIGLLLLDYQAFRLLVRRVLANPALFRRINAGVLALCGILCFLGLFYWQA